MIALGRELQRRGHAVAFATSPPFRDTIARAGLEFREIPPLWTHAELAHWMGRLQQIATPLFQLRELYRAAQPHIPAIIDAMDGVLAGADLLVSSYLFPMNRVIAERHRVPFATFAFAHNTVPSRYYPPDGLPRLRGLPRPVQHTWNRWLWRIGNLAVDTLVNQMIARPLRARGLPLVKDFFSKPARLVIVGVSPGLMRPPFPLPPRFHFTGYCRWQEPINPDIEATLQKFTGGRPVPVLTFGSMVYDNPDAWMARLAARWPAGEKLIVQSGWAGFRTPPECPHFLTIGPMNHDQLFQYASVVIHHGGAGTTASVLHAGKPHIIVPHIGDQNFFAHEIRRLGCGVKLGKARWPERLHRTVRRVLANPVHASKAARGAETLARENGPACAAETLERYVAGAGAAADAPRQGPPAAEALTIP